jgi:hypothetical protein
MTISLWVLPTQTQTSFLPVLVSLFTLPNVLDPPQSSSSLASNWTVSRYLLASRLENLLLRFKVLHDFGRRRWCRRQELEALIGTRHHFCQIIPPDRAFLRRMINLLCCFRNHAQPIRLNTEFHQDLSWCLEFVPSWAEVRFFFACRI